MTFTLHEIFETLQGEGRNTGRPCIFIRFSGCNLTCRWCDTDFSPRLHLATEELLARVATFTARSIIFTGGEPLLQPNLLALARALKDRGYWLGIETNGTLEPSPELRATLDYIATSPKFNAPLNLSCADEVRLVVDDVITPEWCEAIRARIPATDYYLSPCDDGTRLRIHETIELLGALNAECRMQNETKREHNSAFRIPNSELRSEAKREHNSAFRIPNSELRSEAKHSPWRLSLQTHKLAGIP